MTNILYHMIWSGDQTGYKYPALSRNFQLLEPVHLPNYSRRNCFTLNFAIFFSSYFNKSFLPLERTKMFSENFDLFLCQMSIASHRKYFKAFSNSVSAEFQMHLIETIQRHFQITPLPNFLLFVYPFYALVSGVKTVSTSASSLISVCGFRG